MQKESNFKAKLYLEIRKRFPGTEVVINDPTYIQGFPDITVYFPNGHYMLLECKRHCKASHRPNQDYYIYESDLKNNAAFIFPENKEEIMKELERRYMCEME